jgi:hypothetical protein
MDPVKRVVFVLMFVPLVAFSIAGFTEARSNLTVGKRVGRLLPIVSGIALFLVSFDPERVFHVGPAGAVTVSRVMTIAAVVIACSGVFTTYSSRLSAVLVALGGIALAWLWIGNSLFTAATEVDPNLNAMATVYWYTDDNPIGGTDPSGSRTERDPPG